MAKKKEEVSAGKISIDELRKIVNKKAGQEVSFDLLQESPTEVSDWISTGSRWLDSVIARGKLAGIPVGKVSKWIQIKVELRGYKTTFEELQIINETFKPSV